MIESSNNSAFLYFVGPAEFLSNYPHNNQNYLKVRVPKGLTQNQLTRLFNIVPTLEFCRHMTNQYSATGLTTKRITDLLIPLNCFTCLLSSYVVLVFLFHLL